MAQRDLYIDRLRSVMTAMVILHHTAITYGAPAGHSRLWRNTTAASSLLKTALKTVFIFARWLRYIPKIAEPIMPFATVEARGIA